MSLTSRPGFLLVVQRECRWLLRDRVALLVVVGNGGGDRFVGLRASAERNGDTDERATDAKGAFAILG